MARDLFRKNLKFYRKKQDLSQKELSRLCNYDRSYVGKIERGDKDPSVEAIIRIASKLDVPVRKLFQELPSRSAESFLKERRGRESELTQVYRAMFLEATLLGGLLNEKGEWLDVNHSLADFVGCDREELIGTHFTDLPVWTGEGPDWFDSMLDQSIAGHRTMRPLELRKPDDEVNRFQCYLSPLPVHGDALEYVLVEFLERDPAARETYLVD